MDGKSVIREQPVCTFKPASIAILEISQKESEQFDRTMRIFQV
jgi:hypothetical protein